MSNKSRKERQVKTGVAQDRTSCNLQICHLSSAVHWLDDGIPYSRACNCVIFRPSRAQHKHASLHLRWASDKCHLGRRQTVKYIQLLGSRTKMRTPFPSPGVESPPGCPAACAALCSLLGDASLALYRSSPMVLPSVRPCRSASVGWPGTQF